MAKANPMTAPAGEVADEVYKKYGKKKLNKFFALMLDAKKKGLKSFKYNGKTYVGKKHNRLGMIYKKK